jgi:hypothetical protein
MLEIQTANNTIKKQYDDIVRTLLGMQLVLNLS